MIINTEIKELTKNGAPVLDSYGRQKRFLCLSYVDDKGYIKYFTWVIPENMMYQWKYAKKKDEPHDDLYKSWDMQNVVKTPIVGKFSEQRVHEILLDLESWYPEDESIKNFNVLNMPITGYMDIETDVGDDGFPDANSAKNQINTVSFVIKDNVYVLGLANLKETEIEWISKEVTEHCKTFETDYKFTYVYHPNEESLLNDLLFNFIAKCPCITGWNIFGYDWPYIYNRVKNFYPVVFDKMLSTLSPTKTWFKYKPQATKADMIELPMHKAIYDYMEIYKKYDRSIQPKENNSLDWVAERCLKVKKVVHQLGFKEMWEQQKKEYVFYNAIDSVLVREIDLYLKTSSVFFGLANIMHTPLLTAISSTKSIEIVQAEYLYKENRIFPVTKKASEDSNGYEGAFVFEPIPGAYRNVLTLDYASLYPTTMRQFNISPDTYLGKDKNHVRQPNEIKCANGSIYRADIEGFIPKILTDFYAKRKSYKKEMMIAEKEGYELREILKRRLEKINNG